MTEMIHKTDSNTDETLYCTVHPNRETRLRCNNCNRPMCLECAVLTPIGYRCRECVRGQQKVFNTATWTDYIIAAGVAGVLSFLGSLIASFIGFFIIFIGPIAGFVIAEAVRRATGKRRSKLLFQIAAGGTLVGSLVVLLPRLLALLFFPGQAGLGTLLGLLWPGVYAFLVTSSVYYRLAGIRMH
jgi:hypothetical protein